MHSTFIYTSRPFRASSCYAAKISVSFVKPIVYNNGQNWGSLHGTPFVDPKVPDC